MNQTLLYYKEIADFLEQQLPVKEYFCCVYGSYPAKRNTSQSDLDLFVASESVSEDLYRRLEKFILELSNLHGLTQDEEVPYRNKLLVSYADVQSAVSLAQFKSPDDGSITVPKIEKTKEFLSSDHIRLRLIFNALTTPHNFISGNFLTYLNFKNIAEQGLQQLAIQICDGVNSDVENLVNVLMRSSDGEEGEMYLGYKNFDSIRSYLQFILSKERGK
ncbi:MAG: nucleotidyltransferase domain-containing protein [Candidatus Paceibacterota bacterium]